MDRHLRRYSRRSNVQDNPEAARAAHRRAAQFFPGDYIRLDASRAEGFDVPEHAVGNFRVMTARTEPEGRTYTLVRLGAVAKSPADTSAAGALDPYITPAILLYDEVDILDEMHDGVLFALRVPADHPLTWNDEPVEPCPVPLHHQIRSSERSTPLDRHVKARERVRRTSAPDLVVAVPTVNTELGIFIRPKVRPQTTPPVEAVVEAEPSLEDRIRAERQAWVERTQPSAPLATEVIAGLTKSQRRRRRNARLVDLVAGAGSPEQECGCECHRKLADITPGARCDCFLPTGTACRAGRLA